eukprot:GFUD01037747.1.p1 GENE.GFUD01037747.1~~GFUD01037747.1.p1  ORF type:complete len:237 (-),score=83.90 GFUD01037747.1:56-766(-)
MAHNYSKLTVAKLRQNLKERGVEMPSKTKKPDLVSRLLEEDANRPLSGGEQSAKRKVHTMADNYSKLTVAKLQQNLRQRGVEMPSKTKKPDLVSRLLEEDANRPLSGGEDSAKRKVEKTVGAEEKVWLVETNNRHDGYGEMERNVVGIYNTKTDAVKNAKVAFTNMDLYKCMYTVEGDTFEEYAKKIGRHGGVLCELGGEEGEMISVSISAVDLNKEVKSTCDHDNKHYGDETFIV